MKLFEGWKIKKRIMRFFKFPATFFVLGRLYSVE
jgi:hypothetical protein